jgi:3-carboxy-cis,cis-muconate cycloisomerase
MDLLNTLFGTDRVNQIFSDRTRLQRMLDFEAALATAEARVGVIPGTAAAPIAAECKVELFDLDELARASVDAGNLAIPMVKKLTALVGAKDADAARFVHWGATSQDVIDTGLVLQLRDALALICADVDRLCDTLRELADEYRTTPLAARTWLQQAVPTVFGLKAAGWLDAMTRHKERLDELDRRIRVLQFGGAAGTLAALSSRGLEVARELAKELGLELPSLPWHAHRDRVAEPATTLALLTGTLGKIARDISLEMQTEVGEVFEPSGEGRGGSSTMPQKRNPTTCAVVLAAAARVPALTSTMLTAMPQEHERGLGGWQAEWETLPEIVRLSAGALHQLADTVAGLEIDKKRMRENLELSRGLIYAEAVSMALGAKVGKKDAHEMLEAASRKASSRQEHLRNVLLAEPAITAQLSAAEIDRLFDPLNYIGVADEFIDRAIDASKAQAGKAK